MKIQLFGRDEWNWEEFGEELKTKWTKQCAIIYILEFSGRFVNASKWTIISLWKQFKCLPLINISEYANEYCVFDEKRNKYYHKLNQTLCK